MAWILRKKGSDEEHRLLTNREYVVGRKEADIILNGDQSISRKHAVLNISQHDANVANPARIPLVTLKDMSKYGTTLNENKANETGLLVNSGDEITFGILQNVWQITYKPFICSSSALSKEDKSVVRQALTKIGGHLVAEWTPECTLLIMSELTITIKVVNAMVTQCHIVTPKFLEDLISTIESAADKPHMNSYVPSVTEKVLKEEAEAIFAPNPRRKTVFAGKQFFVLSARQLKKLQLAVTRGGGKIEILEQRQKMVDDVLNGQDFCVLQPSTDEAKQDFVMRLTSQLERHGIRFVTEAEIGLAVLYCSTEKFCNSNSSSDVGSYQLGSLQSTSQLFSVAYAESEAVLASVDDVKMEYGEPTDKTNNLGQEIDDNPSSAETVERSWPSFTLEEGGIKSEAAPMEVQETVDKRSVDCSVRSEQRTASQAEPDFSGSCQKGLSLANPAVNAKKDTIKLHSGVEADAFENTSTVSSRVRPKSQSTDPTNNHEVSARVRSVSRSVRAGFLSSRNLSYRPPTIMEYGGDTTVSLKLRALTKRRRVEETEQAAALGQLKRNFKRFKKIPPKRGSGSYMQVTLQVSDRNKMPAPRLTDDDQDAENELVDNPSSIEFESADMFNWPSKLDH